MKLSKAQHDALGILVAADGQEVEAWKQRSTTGPPWPRINMLAAGSLVRMGLAKAHLPRRWSPYTHDMRYSVTDAGREAWAASL